jgi:hypothetical protein
MHHYHDDFNEVLLAAKGAPLAWDFGNQYQPIQRAEAWYHNRVSFSKAGQPAVGSTGKLMETIFLPRTADYSYGLSTGSGNQQDHRHVLLVNSDDPLGANYVLVRDATADGQPNQKFYWNLWCLSKQPEVQGSVVHFPGQMGVDLDVHLLSPEGASIEQDQWSWKVGMAYWGNFGEEMFGMRVEKAGSAQDFLALLYPRAAGQEAAKVTPVEGEVTRQLPGGGREWAPQPRAAVRLEHMEGVDLVLLSPGKDAKAADGDLTAMGEVAFARQYADGKLRMAALKGSPALAEVGNWAVGGNAPVSLEVTGRSARGETDGPARVQSVRIPEDYGPAVVIVDGKPVTAQREGMTLSFSVPAGYYTFLIQPK